MLGEGSGVGNVFAAGGAPEWEARRLADGVLTPVEQLDGVLPTRSRSTRRCGSPTFTLWNVSA